MLFFLMSLLSSSVCGRCKQEGEKNEPKAKWRNHHVEYFKDIFEQRKRKLMFSEKGNSFLDTGWLVLSLVLNALVNIKNLKYTIVSELVEPINNYILSICHVSDD